MQWTGVNRTRQRQDELWALPVDVIRAALQPGVDCLPLEVLGRYVDALLSPIEHAATVRHLEACMACYAEHALLHSFTAGRITAEERRPVQVIVRALRRRERLRFDAVSGSPAVGRYRPLSSSWRVALGLAVVLLAVASGHEFSISRPSDLAARGSTGGGASRSLAVELVAPRGDQAVAPRRLEWRPLNGATLYRVRLVEVDRHEVWSIETMATEVDLPDAVRALVVPAKTLVWDVTAYDAKHAPIGESPPERFRLGITVRE